MKKEKSNRADFSFLRKISMCLLFCFLAISLSAQIWQWSVAVKNKSANPQNNFSTAFMWIPSSSKNIKAVIVAQNNMEEISILEDSGFRKSMSKLDVAEVWITPLFDPSFDFTNGAWETLQGALDSLALVSGYREIAKAPLIGFGHSACASFPYYLGACQPERTVACLSISGQWPYFRGGYFARDVWGERNIDYIPSLETMGEYESADTWSVEGLKERVAHPKMPLSMLACPAEGHFAYTPEKAQYLALYIQKALRYGHVDPTKTGYLVESWKKDLKPTYDAAPVGKYKGNPKDAFWYFDKEMAEATIAYGARFRGQKRQLVGISQKGKIVEQQNDHLQLHPRFLTEKDGKTIVLSPFFYDTVPGVSPRPSNWSGKPVGSAIGHAKNNSPIVLKKIVGPFEVKNDTVLELAWNRAVNLNEDKDSLCFVVYHGGDNEYRPTFQQVQLNFPLYRMKGKVQTISFEPLANCNAQSLSSGIALKAVSSSHLPVNFYVNAGPCEVKNSRLVFERIPLRTRFPMKVTVTAWQSGNDEYQTAKPITQTFFILRPE